VTLLGQEQTVLGELWKIYNNFQELIRHADGKAQINIAIASIFISISIPFVQHLGSLSRILIAISLSAIMLSVIFSIYAIYPRVKHKEVSPTPFFFKSVTKNPQIMDRFEEMFQSSDTYIRLLKQDITILASIATRKFDILRIATILLTVGITIGVFSAILSLFGL